MKFRSITMILGEFRGLAILALAGWCACSDTVTSMAVGGTNGNHTVLGLGGSQSGLGTYLPPDSNPLGTGGTTSNSGSKSDPSETCRNIDIVFSIDNSGSMSEEQEAMGTTIFPAFANKLKQMMPNLESFRVGVLDACPRPAFFLARGRGGPCNFSSGKPWIESSSPKLTEEFQCVGAIDSSLSTCTGKNDDEQPASAASASLENPAISGPNAGFLRKDAILVIVAMTDEDEKPTGGLTASQVFKRLVAIKGSPKLEVFLGIGGPANAKCNGIYGDAKPAPTLKGITDLFIAEERGVYWDICAGSFEIGLDKAISTIRSACAQAPSVVIP